LKNLQLLIIPLLVFISCEEEIVEECNNGIFGNYIFLDMLGWSKTEGQPWVLEYHQSSYDDNYMKLCEDKVEVYINDSTGTCYNYSEGTPIYTFTNDTTFKLEYEGEEPFLMDAWNMLNGDTLFFFSCDTIMWVNPDGDTLFNYLNDCGTIPINKYLKVEEMNNKPLCD